MTYKETQFVHNCRECYSTWTSITQDSNCPYCNSDFVAIVSILTENYTYDDLTNAV